LIFLCRKSKRYLLSLFDRSVSVSSKSFGPLSVLHPDDAAIFYQNQTGPNQPLFRYHHDSESHYTSNIERIFCGGAVNVTPLAVLLDRSESPALVVELAVSVASSLPRSSISGSEKGSDCSHVPDGAGNKTEAASFIASSALA